VAPLRPSSFNRMRVAKKKATGIQPKIVSLVRLEGRFSFPADVLESAERSGGQDRPQATAGGGAKRS
jgi:hypothetical protein